MAGRSSTADSTSTSQPEANESSPSAVSEFRAELVTPARRPRGQHAARGSLLSLAFVGLDAGSVEVAIIYATQLRGEHMIVTRPPAFNPSPGGMTQNRGETVKNTISPSAIIAC